MQTYTYKRVSPGRVQPEANDSSIANVSALKPSMMTSEDNVDRMYAREISSAAGSHPWTFATADAVARSLVGAGWKLVPADGYTAEVGDDAYRRAMNFFGYRRKKWDNIKDFTSLPDKIAYTIRSYRLYGQAAWEIVRNKNGNPIGFDIVNGYVIPQVNKRGYFLDPAFLVYPWGADWENPVRYKKEDIVFMYNPGVTGNVNGESIYLSLTKSTIPSDLYASVAFREIFKNVNAPYNGVWSVDPSVSDDDFKSFRRLLQERYSGPTNFGKNPLLIRGKAEFQETRSRSREDAPYLEGRDYNRQEFYAVTGVTGTKLGTTSEANKSNFRETRREFQENVLRFVSETFEDVVYDQVMVRTLGIPQWRLKFNPHDVTNAIEQATIDMRYILAGVHSPNEIRAQRGYDPIEGGDEFYPPKKNDNSQSDSSDQGGGNSDKSKSNNRQSDTPNQQENGRESDPARPPRDEESPDTNKSIVSDLIKLKRVVKKQLSGKSKVREFNSDRIPKEFLSIVHAMVSSGRDYGDISEIIDQMIEMENYAE